ncbi:unnamed protein product [Sphagnum jensenii]|uniref:Tetraspanin n=1 Tax=Sphagnum jensenii TaxID=128206 RepID=A0ABP1B868_9BRYO
MTGRTFTGFIAVFSTTLLLILNLMVTVGGVASLVIEFLLEHRPSQTGWLLVIVSAFTVASGLIGLCSSTRRGCFTLQLVLLAFSLVGLIAAALSIFFKAQQVLNDMSPKIARNTAIKVLRLDAAVLFITFCVQVAVLVLGVCVNCCDLNDHYEEIEMNRGMARTQGAADNRAAMKGESKAAQLAERMKKKYGKWAENGSDSKNSMK